MVRVQKGNVVSPHSAGKLGGQPRERNAGGEVSGSRQATSVAASSTVQPSRRHIRCLECGYEFNLTGRMAKTNCPKCRATLDLAGFTITGECREELKTLGNIRIKPGAAVSGTRLVATDIELAGRVVGSSVEAFRQLVIQAGADFIRREIKAVDLRVEPGAEMVLRVPAVYRHVEILGRVKAVLFSTGILAIRAGGFLMGEAHGEHLTVENGGGLVGAVRIGPEGGVEARQAQERMLTDLAGRGDEHVMVSGYDLQAAEIPH